MSRAQFGRHLPAFILLFLAKEPMHGLLLVNRMNKTMPSIRADGPAIYRCLSDLEKNQSVTSHWVTDGAGAAKKCYTITDSGKQILKAFKFDIEEKKKNFDFFLNELDNLQL